MSFSNNYLCNHLENFHIPSSSPPHYKAVCWPTYTLILRYSLVDRGRRVSLAHCGFPAGFYQDSLQKIVQQKTHFFHTTTLFLGHGRTLESSLR